MVQEEASKASKRARRRAAGEEASGDNPSGEGDAQAEEQATESGAPAAPGAAPAAPPPNRQARRSAAAKARAERRRERVEAAQVGLDASEMVDDALVRFTDKLSRFGRRHWNTIQWVIGLGLIGGFGYQVYSWRLSKVAARSSDALFVGVLAENGTIGDPKDQGKPNENGIIDPTPIFETEEARLAAALSGYRKAAEARPGTPVQAFAWLGEAGVLFESGKPDEALAVFERVLASPDGQKEPELRSGALLGRGLCLEAKGDLAGARRAFEELGTVAGQEGPALFQQARMAQRQGDIGAAKSLLTKLFKVLGPPKAPNFTGLPDRPEFLRDRAVQLAGLVDPLEKDVKIPSPPLGADAVQQMLQQLQESGVASPSAPNP